MHGVFVLVALCVCLDFVCCVRRASECVRGALSVTVPRAYEKWCYHISVILALDSERLNLLDYITIFIFGWLKIVVAKIIFLDFIFH